MENKQKDSLALAAAKYPRLKNITESSGWKDVESMLFDEYCEQLDIIKAPKAVKAEVEARAVIKFIERFLDKVNSELNFAKVAKERYAKKYLNQMPEEG